MKVIIAGGRDYKPTNNDKVILNHLHLMHEFTEVVSGKAKGADTFGEDWANENHIHVEPFPVDWKDMSPPCSVKYDRNGLAYNCLAGHNRNRRMAEYGDAVILFKGDRGTANMRKLAKQYDLKILYDAGNKGR